MKLLKQIAGQDHLTELLSSDDVNQAETYEIRGWVKLRRALMSKGKDTYGQRKVYAAITDAGRRAIEDAHA